MYNITLSALLILTLWLIPLEPVSAQNPGAAQDFINRFGVITADQNTRVNRAQQVFKNLRRVADKKAKYTPRLIVVNSDKEPWAIALADGHIVLSRKALDLCYQGIDPLGGDTRLAFVLGHELAHLAKDDFWHAEVYRALANVPESVGLRKLLKNTADVPEAAQATRRASIRQKELQADDWGFLYAAVAGYPVHQLLLSGKTTQTNFFQHWVRQTGVQADHTHPDPADRARLLKVRLQTVLDKISYFDFAVRFTYFGRFTEAIQFLEVFQQVFPSREVFGNLGYSYLRLAEQTMAPAQLYRFWLPRMLDAETRASRLKNRVSRTGQPRQLTREAKQHLQQAQIYLQRAIASDPAYHTARLNLFTVYFHLGEYAQAQAQLKGLSDPEQVRALTALTLYAQSSELGTDLSPNAIALLQQVIDSKGPASDNVKRIARYNLARILSEQNQVEQATGLWKQLRASEADIPSPYYAQACDQVKTKTCQSPINQTTLCNIPLAIQLPAQPGRDLWSLPGCKSDAIKDWQTQTLALLEENRPGHIHTAPDHNSQILEINCFVEMVVVKENSLKIAESLKFNERCRHAATETTAGSVIPMSPHRAVLLRRDQAVELWVMRQRKPDL